MSIKFALLLLAACLAVAVAMPAGGNTGPIIIIRRARSPQPGGGNLDIGYSQDRQRGREANVQYNHNLYTSRDGRGSIDAYANANRNFDHNRNNFGGGVQGKWRF